MAPDSQTRKIFLLLIGFTLVLSTVSAAPEITIDPDDKVIWEGSSDNVLNAQIENCKESSNVYVEDSAGIFGPLEGGTYNEDTGEFTQSFDSSDFPGEYVVKAECENNSSSANFALDNLKMDLQSPNNRDTWYVGFNNDPVKLDFSSRLNSFSSDNVNLVNVSLDGEEVRRKDNFDKQSIGIRGDLLADIFDSDKNRYEEVEFQVNSYYNSGGDFVNLTESRTIQVSNWKVSKVKVNPDSKLTSDQFSQLNLEAEIGFRGTPINQINSSFGPDNFYLAGYSNQDKSKWFNGELVDPETGKYSLSLGPIPQELQKNMRIMFESDQGGKDPIKLAEVTVEDVEEYIWSPKVLTSGQSAVEADFKLSYDDGSYENFTSTNGDFSRKIWPGSHDMEVTFPQAKLKLSEVKLDEGNSGRNIIYDYFFYSNIGEISSESQIMDGIKPVNLLHVNFAYPFEKASLEMRYNNEEIDTSDDMKVYECTRWHASDGECRSEEGWEQLSANDVRTVPASWKSTKYSTAKFSVEPFKSRDNGDILQNAYIVGTSADLVLNGGLSVTGPEGGQVATGSEITVEGNINSENEKAVEGADVEVAFYQGDNEISSLETVQTDITGRFVAKGDAPDEPGNYSVRLTADKENYNELRKKFDNRFETFVKEGIEVQVDDQLEVEPGQDVNTDISVQNTGQTDMNDISLSFEGMDSKYYSVSEASFDEIPAGEEKSTELTISLPSDYCDDGCGDWPSLDVSATATNPDDEEFEANLESLQVQISRVSGSSDNESETGQETSDTEEPNDPDSSFTESVSDLENATGEFIASQSSVNLALGLIMVFMMVLAGAVKKEDGNGGSRRGSSRGDRDGRDGGRPRVQKPNVGGSNSNVEQVEPVQEDNSPEGDEVDTVVEQIESDEHDVESQIDAIAGSVAGEEQEDTAVVEVDDEHQDSSDESSPEELAAEEDQDGEKKFVCEETGKEFDTKAALKLHRKINGLDN